MVNKTDKILRKIRKDNRSFEPKSPIASGMYLPNHSGDLSAGRVNTIPTTDQQPVNKKYVDIDNPVHTHTLDVVENPTADVDFNFGNNKTLTFRSVDTSVTAGEGVFNFQAGGAFNGALVHIHQHTGNPGANTILLELEAEDADVIPIKATSAGPSFSLSGASLDMNTQKIINVVDPTANQEVATKKYVDDGPPSHTIASHSDTTGTGAELNTLTDNSMADTLHRHSELSASDGTPDQALVVDAAGLVGIGMTPLTKFNVSGTTTITHASSPNDKITIQPFTDGNTYVNAYGDGAGEGGFIFRTNDATVGSFKINSAAPVNSLTTNATGVGIGTNSPNGKLHLKDTTDNISMKLETDKVDGLAAIDFINDVRTWSMRTHTDDSFRIMDNTPGKTNYPFKIEPAVATGDQDDALIIDASGNVVITEDIKVGSQVVVESAAPVTNAIRVTGEYMLTEDNELDYSASFTDAMAAATITFTELPANTVAILVDLELADTGPSIAFRWQRSSGGPKLFLNLANFADVGTNFYYGQHWMPTDGNSLYVTQISADNVLNFKIIGYKVGE